MIEKIMDLYKSKTQKECYKFEIEEGVTPGIMDDKIGGIPYMPIGEDYPLDKNGNQMILLIQINLSGIELEDYPQEGILEIFIDKECSWPCDYKVRYYKEITNYREDLADNYSDNYIYEKPLKIKLTKDIEHMPSSDYRFYDLMSKVIKEVAGVDVKGYTETTNFFKQNGANLFDEVYKTNIFPGNLGGYADFTQNDPRPIENDKNATECLVKIDSNLGHGINIGDSGIIFVFISKENIKLKNFDKAIMDWDCC